MSVIGYTKAGADAAIAAAVGAGGGGAVSSVAGKTGAVSLVKADVGLANVDNTSDANKPVSTAQATALAAKLAAASNLSDLASVATARTNLGLGGAAVLNVGTAAGTVAAGDDSRFSGAGGSSPSGIVSVRSAPYNAVGDCRNFYATTTAASTTVTSQLATPTGVVATPATIGGTLAAGTYGYRITATNRYGETLASATVTATTTGTTGSVGLTWTAVLGADEYRIYGRTSGSEVFLISLSSERTAWTDANLAVTGGALPSSNTTGPFLSAHAGKPIYISGAGAAGVQYVGTVATFVSSSQITLSAAASTTVTMLWSSVGTDDSTAINAAVAALTDGSTLLFPAGNYLCGGVSITGRTGLSVIGQGGARITCTVENNEPLYVEKSRIVRIADLGISAASTTSRQAGGSGIHTKWCVRVLVENNIVSHTTGVGIFTEAVSQYVVSGNEVADTGADGIHNTKCSSDFSIVGNRCMRTGDDSISIVGYQANGADCTRFSIVGNTIFQSSARGISVVGASRGAVTGNVIQSTTGAGILVLQDNSFKSFGNSDINVEANTITDANTFGTVSTHAAIHIYATDANFPNTRITVNGNHIYAPQLEFIKVDGGAALTSTEVDIVGNHCIGPQQGIPIAGINIGGNADTVDVRNNNIALAYKNGIQSFPSTARIHDNLINFPNQSNTSGVWGITRPGGTPSIAYNNLVIPDGSKTALSGNVSIKPAVAAVAGSGNAGTSPPTPVAVTNSNDQNMVITFGTGTTAVGTGAYVTVTFAAPRSVVPKVDVSPNNQATAVLAPYVVRSTVSATSFQIGLGVAGALSQGAAIYDVTATVNDS